MIEVIAKLAIISHLKRKRNENPTRVRKALIPLSCLSKQNKTKKTIPDSYLEILEYPALALRVI